MKQAPEELLKVSDSSLTEKQKEILRRQEHINETGKKILASMSEADPSKPYKHPIEVENMIRDIFHDMNIIAQLAGGRRTKSILEACEELQEAFRHLQLFAGDHLNGQKMIMKHFLDYASRVVVPFNDNTQPFKLHFEVEPLLYKVKLMLSRGGKDNGAE